MDTENRQKRLLCIVGGMNAGGAETFLMKVYRALDKTKYQMDFCVAKPEAGYYDQEIIAMGGKIYHTIPKSKNCLKSYLAIKDLVKREHYHQVMRVSQHALSSIELLAARQGGAKTLIYRSSNSQTGGGSINRLLHHLFRWLPQVIPTVRIAPSTEAAEFMFGKNSLKKGNAQLVKNAIVVADFSYDPGKRAKIRKELGMADRFVVGHVGRFNHQKNHGFLIDIFSEIVKKKPDSILLLVGEGEMENELHRKIDALNLTDHVIFTGVRADVPELLMAMDVFIFPSYFEGMPNTVIEAQATGLQCVISDRITKEVQITECVCFKALESSAEEWATAALENVWAGDRKNMADCLIKQGYDIETLVKEFEKMVFAQ